MLQLETTLPHIKNLLFFREINATDIRKAVFQAKMGPDISAKYPLSEFPHYTEYYFFVRSIALKLDKIAPLDLWTIIFDKNLGQGEFKAEILAILLDKPGAKEACLFVHRYNWTILTAAAETRNYHCFELIKKRLIEYDCWEYQSNLVDIVGCTALDYLQHPPGKYRRFYKDFESDDLVNCYFQLARIITSENSSLQTLARHGDAKNLKKCIQTMGVKAKSAILHFKTTKGRTILHEVAKSGSIECLNIIIDLLGEDIHQLYIAATGLWMPLDHVCAYGWTPLYYACKYSQLTMIKRLITLFPQSLEEFTKTTSPSFPWEYILKQNNLSVIHLICSKLPKDNRFMINFLEQESQFLTNDKSVLPYTSAAAFFVMTQFFLVRNGSSFIENYDHEETSFIFREAIKLHQEKNERHHLDTVTRDYTIYEDFDFEFDLA